MRSFRITAQRADVDGLPVRCTYADAFVVLRDGADQPGTTDWEVQIRTDEVVSLTMDRHDVALHVVDGSTLRGAAIVRFSDGHRHLFRGDGPLDGFVDDTPEELRAR